VSDFEIGKRWKRRIFKHAKRKRGRWPAVLRDIGQERMGGRKRVEPGTLKGKGARRSRKSASVHNLIPYRRVIGKERKKKGPNV